MKKRLITTLLAFLLLASAVTGVLLFSNAAEEKAAFDASTYDYDALYIKDGLISWFDPSSAKAGDTVETALPDKSGHDNNFVLTTLNASYDTGWTYGDGYLQIGTGGYIRLSDIIAPPTTEGSTAAYTLEYIFSTLDLPRQSRGISSSNFVTNSFPYCQDLDTYSIGGWAANIAYISKENRATLRALAEAYQKAQNDTALQATYSFMPNEADLATYDVDGSGDLSFTETATLLNEKPNMYYPLTLDYDKCIQSGIAKTTFYLNGTWKADYDWKNNTTELFRMKEGTTRKLSFVLEMSGTAAGKTSTAAKVYRDTVSVSSTSAEGTANTSITLSKDLAARIYGIRLYDRALTQEEIDHNHFVDVVKYYQMDPSFYLDADDLSKNLYNSALKTVVVGTATKEEANAAVATALNALASTDENDYSKLFVQDGLLLMINPLTNTGTHAEGDTVSVLADLAGNAYTTKNTTWTATGGINFPCDSALDLGNILPTVGEYGVQIFYAHSDKPVGVDTKTNAYGMLTIGPASYSGKYAPPEVNSVPGGITFALLNMMDGTTGKMSWKRDFDTSWGASKQPDLFAEPYGSIIEFTNNFTLDAKSGATVSIIKNGNAIGNATVPYGEYTKGTLKFGGYFNKDLYAILAYDHKLTADEMKQNHFALLMSYYKVDMTSFSTIVNDATKARLYDEFAKTKPGETTREHLQTIVDNFAMTGGTLGVIKAEDYIGFAGMQTRIKDYASARGLFYVNEEKLKQLESMGSLVEYGVLMAEAAEGRSAEDLTLSLNRAIGEYNPTKDYVTSSAAYRRGETTSLGHAYNKDGKLYFAATIPTVELDNLDSAALNKEYYMRGYMVIDIAGTSFVFYADATSALFGDSISINEAATYFLYSGFADSPVLISLCGEYAAAGANAALDAFKQAESAYLTANAAAALIERAHEGASLARAEYSSVSGGISVTMSLTDAMTKGPQAASAKSQSIIYANAGLDKYATAVEQMTVSFSFAEKIGGIAYDAAIAAGADNAAAERIRTESAEKILEQLTVLDTYLTSIAELETELANIADAYSNDTNENKLQQVIGAKNRLTINSKSLSTYTIVTNDASLEAAEALQKMFLKRFGSSVGLYNIDNPYIGDHYDYTKQYALFVGITADEIAAEAGEQVYSVYGEGRCVFIEGNTVEAIEAGTTALVKELAGATGRVQITVDRADNALMNQTYTPLVSFNHQDTYPAVTVSSYDAEGVWEVFKQKVAEIPKEISVIEEKDPGNYLGSTKLQYYVATDGNDSNAGTIDAPFATLQQALDKVAYETGAIIWIRGGIYTLSQTPIVNAAHSGTVTSPLFISAYPGEEVVFTAAPQVDAAQLKSVDDAITAGIVDASVKTQLNTFVEDNHKNVYVIKLDPLKYTFDTKATSTLYVGDTAFHVARYPNDGANDPTNKITNGRIAFSNTDDGTTDDIKKVGHVSTETSSLYAAHKSETGPWELYYDDAPYAARINSYDLTNTTLYTYAAVFQEWERSRYALTLHTDSTNGRQYMRSSTNCTWGAMESAGNNMFFYNIIEELDAENEYYLDCTNGLLYVWSSEPLAASTEILYCSTALTLLQVDGASNVVIDNIHFTKTKATAVSVARCRNVIVQNSIFSTISGSGISMTANTQSGLLDCELATTSTNTVAGPLTQIKSTHNFVQNCLFHGEAELWGTTLSVGGFGDIISHNRFYEVGLTFGSAFECIIEYNDFDKDGQYTYDGGPIYLSGPGNKRSNHVRYNLFHNLNVSRYGIYLDDLSSGNYIYCNIVEYAEENSGGGKCVNIHGGNMNVVYNNIGLRAGEAGFRDNGNYYVKTIDGQKTNVGGLGYRWTSMSSGLASSYTGRVNAWGLEAFQARFPLYEWYGAQVVQHVEERSTRDDWHVDNKVTGIDDLEMFLRMPHYNVYVNNVMYDCLRGWMIFGESTAKFENNLNFASSADLSFTDPDNDNYTFKSDSVVYESIPDFEEIPFDRIGRIQDLKN